MLRLRGRLYLKNSVCRLNKSIYGLKQASRQWNIKLSEILLRDGFIQSTTDNSLFIKNSGSSVIVILIYVDDMILIGNDALLLQQTKTNLQTHFKIKDLGPVRFFLGIEIARASSGIHLNQRKYTLELLEEYGLLGAKPLAIPMDTKAKLGLESGTPIVYASFYRQLIGKLIYLSVTRPDISFAVQKLSQYMTAPHTDHLQAAFRVLCYLKLAPSQGLWYSASSSVTLSAYSDADWASCLDSRRSIIGYCVFLGSSLVSWKAKKQATVSRSSSESEYRALAQTSCELLWLSALLKELHISCPQPFTIFCDNQSALHLTNNPVHHERSKHIELDCHFIRDHIKSGLLKPMHVSTTHQLAHLLTKPLPSDHFQYLLSKMGIQNLCSPS
ncbi:PREDICTED: uncharacterized protein LOC109117278 [Tarenaya hassleriana]|uniref:uncharacterized protein LOC109117278 n=1 Tax=Tarenaya hassleriana TaxID=28532 RepID=UPI0008FD614E|nr:PREDICTED: uncharacterized protein LOC109117278 [Tarenaya hassleriana]